MTEQRTVSGIIRDDVYKSLQSLDAAGISRMIKQGQIPSIVINEEPVRRNKVSIGYIEAYTFALGLELVATMCIADSVGSSGVQNAHILEALCYIPVAADTISRLFTDRSVYSNIPRIYHYLIGR